MHKIRKMFCLPALLCLLLVLTFLTETVTFAWLSEALQTGTFSVKSSDVSTMETEVWVNASTASGDWAQGWYVDSYDTAQSTETEKRFSSIGTFGEEGVTFTPASPIALRFGTINNLAQEQENQPIYLKFTIKLKPRTSNKVILTYANDAETVGGQYLSLYQIDFNEFDDDAQEYLGNLVTDAETTEELNDIEKYPFLRFHYFVSNVNYTFTPGVDDLTSVKAEYIENSAVVTTTADFVSLFDEKVNEDVIEYTVDNEESHSTLFENASGNDEMTYIYVKINVRPDTLSNALTNSNLKNYMPAYLLFAVILGVEIQTSAYTGS